MIYKLGGLKGIMTRQVSAFEIPPCMPSCYLCTHHQHQSDCGKVDVMCCIHHHHVSCSPCCYQQRLAPHVGRGGAVGPSMGAVAVLLSLWLSNCLVTCFHLVSALWGGKLSGVLTWGICTQGICGPCVCQCSHVGLAAAVGC